MKTFFHPQDLGDIRAALAEAQLVKKDRYAFQQLGKNKTLLMVFFNNSLRTRLSTQKAARCECRSMEAGDRAWCHHGWRQV